MHSLATGIIAAIGAIPSTITAITTISAAADATVHHRGINVGLIVAALITPVPVSTIIHGVNDAPAGDICPESVSTQSVL